MKSEDLISEEKINKQELVDIIRNEWVNNSIVNKEIYTDIKSKKTHIDYKNLKELYIIYEVIDCDPVIIKCPVETVTSRYVTINVKDRYKDHYTITKSGLSAYITRECYSRIKIKKDDINSNFGYKASTSYSEALAYLLLTHKERILAELRAANDIELYERYVIASEIDLIYGLEYIAKYLEMDYLFKLEDDTIINPNVNHALHLSKYLEKFSD